MLMDLSVMVHTAVAAVTSVASQLVISCQEGRPTAVFRH